MVRRFAVLVAAVALAPLCSVLPAQAIPVCKADYQCSRTYYSNSAHTEVVGGSTAFCDGTYDSWGTQSSYVVTTQVPCG